MSDLSQFVSEDSRKPIERLRRHVLHKIADAKGIDYPPQAPKDTMIQLLEAHGVDVTQEVGSIQWRVVHPSAEAQQAAAMHGSSVGPQMVPVQQPHATSRNGVDSSLVLQERMAKEEQESAKVRELEEKNAELQADNARLRELFESRLTELEAKAETVSKPEIPEKYQEMQKLAKRLGIARPGLKKDELRGMLEEHLG